MPLANVRILHIKDFFFELFLPLRSTASSYGGRYYIPILASTLKSRNYLTFNRTESEMRAPLTILFLLNFNRAQKFWRNVSLFERDIFLAPLALSFTLHFF